MFVFLPVQTRLLTTGTTLPEDATVTGECGTDVSTLLLAWPENNTLAMNFTREVCILLCKAKRQYLLTLQVSRYCSLALHGSIIILAVRWSIDLIGPNIIILCGSPNSWMPRTTLNYEVMLLSLFNNYILNKILMARILGRYVSTHWDRFPVSESSGWYDDLRGTASMLGQPHISARELLLYLIWPEWTMGRRYVGCHLLKLLPAKK